MKEKTERPEKELLNIKIEPTLKRQFDEVCSELGFTMTAAITMWKGILSDVYTIWKTMFR